MRRDSGRLGQTPSATCRRDRERPQGERAGGRRAGVAAGSRLRLVGIAVARVHQEHRAVARACFLLRAGDCLRAPPRVAASRQPQPGATPSNPEQTGGAYRSCPPRPSKNLGATLRAQPQPDLSSAGQSLSCGHCLAYLRVGSGAGDAGQWREASSRWILLDCAGSKGEPSFETLPPGSARWCHACPALEAPHSLTRSRWHRVSFARISMTRSRPAACRVGFSDTGSS